MNHDALFKELLQTFFAEFMALFLPNEAAQVQWDSVRFLPGEAFTEMGGGEVRRPDLVAEVRARDGTVGLVLFHIEVQAERRGNMGFRMSEYHALLRLKFRQPVFPVVVYLSRGTGGITQEGYTEGVLGRTFLRFEYVAIGLPDLQADTYEHTDNPLAVSLSALMKQQTAENQGTRKFRLLRIIARSNLSEKQKLVLALVVNKRLELTDAEQVTYRDAVAQEGTEEVMTVYEMIREDGREEGLQQGLQQGLRDMLLRQMRLRFGTLPPELEERIGQINHRETLEILSERVLVARTLDEMQIDRLLVSA